MLVQENNPTNISIILILIITDVLPYFSCVSVLWSTTYNFVIVYVLWIAVCPFVLFLLAIVLSVLLRYTNYDYLFVIFKLFLHTELSIYCTYISCSFN